MGTSKSFSELTKQLPNWPSLSRTVTTSCNGNTVSKERLSQIAGGYVTAIGGSSKAGRGHANVVGKGGIRTAKRLVLVGGQVSIVGGNLRQSLQ